MHLSSRLAAASLILSCSWALVARAQEPATPTREVEQVASRDNDLTRSATSGTGLTHTHHHTLTAPADPYGFAQVLNHYRAMAGLPPVAYDPNLSSWASQNNAAQCRRGIGHHVNPNCFQNCGWNQDSVMSVAREWMSSPGHRRNMLSPSIRSFGIAYGPGPYWTMNAR